MGCVMRPVRKKLSLSEWDWCLKVLAPINKGQFHYPENIEYRGSIWTEDRRYRAVIEKGPDYYHFEIRTFVGRLLMYSGYGLMEDALSEMLKLLFSLYVDHSVASCDEHGPVEQGKL